MYMTVGDLKKALMNVPDDAEVRYQRIEDVYFEKHGWDNCVKKLQFYFETDPEEFSQYVEVHTAFLHIGDNVFVLNAHY